LGLALFSLNQIAEKRTGVPDGFTWQGRLYRVVSLLREWHDYTPRGKSKAMYEKGYYSGQRLKPRLRS